MGILIAKNDTIENRHYDYVDALRGLAVLLVIAVHARQYGSFNVPQILRNISENSQYGVQLFYIMSAFTLFLSLKSRFAKEHYPIKNFFVRRFFRIAPMFYIAIIVDFIGFQQWKMKMLTEWGWEINVGNILLHFLFLHGFRASWINTLVLGGWSVGVEMMFYAVLPIIFLKIKTINHAIIFFLISNTIRPFMNKLLSSNIDIGQFDDYWYQYFPNQLPIFCLGIILYFLVFENENTPPPPTESRAYLYCS